MCIPSFNRADLIVETLESLLRQTYRRWEAVVVDDGSSDRTWDVVTAYSARDSRIRVLRREREPKGACACRNIAVNSSRAKYVLFLDSDDLLAPFCIEQRVRVLEENPDADFAIFGMLLFSGTPLDADRLWNIDSAESDLLRLLRMDPICQGTGTLWRRESFVDLGLWDEGLHVWQDIDLHLRAFSGPWKYVKRLDLPPDAFLRETMGSLSRGSYQSREKLESRAQVARRAVGLLAGSGRHHLIPEVSNLCSSVVIGASLTNNFDLAQDMLDWGRKSNVLSRSEFHRLRAVKMCRYLRLDRVGVVRRFRDALAGGFVSPSTLGQVRVAAQPS